MRDVRLLAGRGGRAGARHETTRRSRWSRDGPSALLNQRHDGAAARGAAAARQERPTRRVQPRVARRTGVLALNLVSSPGAGKTTLLERTIRALAPAPDLRHRGRPGDHPRRRAGPGRRRPRGADQHRQRAATSTPPWWPVGLQRARPADGSAAVHRERRQPGLSGPVRPRRAGQGAWSSRSPRATTSRSSTRTCSRPRDLVISTRSTCCPTSTSTSTAAEHARRVNPASTFSPAQRGAASASTMDALACRTSSSRTSSPAWSSASLRGPANASRSCLDGSDRAYAPPCIGGIENYIQNVISPTAPARARPRPRRRDPVLRLADDELVGNLLVLAGLHLDDVGTRVQRTLDQVRPTSARTRAVPALQHRRERRRAPPARGQLRRLPVLGAHGEERDRGRDLGGGARRGRRRGRGHGRRRSRSCFRSSPSESKVSSSSTAVDSGVGAPRARRAARDDGPRAARGDAEVVVANLSGTLVAYVDRCAVCLQAVSRGTL